MAITAVRYRYNDGRFTRKTVDTNNDDEGEEEQTLESYLACVVSCQEYAFLKNFTLEDGTVLQNVRVAYTSHGVLNEARNNVVVVCHALTGSADARGDWWKSLFDGKEAIFNSRDSKIFVICLNVLGSPYGTTSPLTRQSDDLGRSLWGPRFPRTTIRDDVRLHKLVLDSLQVEQVAMVIGGSMGGCHALEWAYLGRSYVRSVVAIACAAQQSAWAIGWNEMQRTAIRSDGSFNEGYYSTAKPPLLGLGAARMAAMLTYRASDSWTHRFGRNKQRSIASIEFSTESLSTSEDSMTTRANDNTPLEHKTTIRASKFAAEEYLNYQQAKFNARFDANCYIALTHKMDTHDVTRGRTTTHPAPAMSSPDSQIREALQQIQQPALIIGIDTDILYPISEQQQLANGIPQAEFNVLTSTDGHDAFLLETAKMNALVKGFMQRHSIGQT